MQLVALLTASQALLQWLNDPSVVAGLREAGVVVAPVASAAHVFRLGSRVPVVCGGGFGELAEFLARDGKRLVVVLDGELAADCPRNLKRHPAPRSADALLEAILYAACNAAVAHTSQMLAARGTT
jgi:hypothetical protein